MTDIVKLLRDYGRPDHTLPRVSTMVLQKAADEIERLRETTETLQAVVTGLEDGIAAARRERDEWGKLCGEARAEILKEIEAHGYTINERDATLKQLAEADAWIAAQALPGKRNPLQGGPVEVVRIYREAVARHEARKELAR